MKRLAIYMKTLILFVCLVLASAFPALAEGDDETPHYPLKKPVELHWSFSGPFGKYDPAQLQRGFKVYREVCSACHSLEYVAFRTLIGPQGLHYTEEQVKTIAGDYTVIDGPNDDGEMFERAAIPSDRFPLVHPNEQAARAANNGAYPPDFSLLAKARAVERGFPQFVFDIFTQYQEGGPDYIYSLLTGYEPAPPGVKLEEGTYYNPYFNIGDAIAMAPPLENGLVTYDDGTPETVDNYARDVSAFMMWTAEPNLPQRKKTGVVVFIFLAFLAGLMYLVKRKVWANQH